MLPIIRGTEEIPEFQINYEQCASNRDPIPSILGRVGDAVVFSFACIASFSLALGSATYLTVRYSWTSFKQTVIGYEGKGSSWSPPRNLYTAGLRLFYWGLGLGLNVAHKTLEGFVQRRGMQEKLSQEEIGTDLDLRHFCIQNQQINAAKVPENVKVGTLSKLFDEINFNRETEPGYMSAASRTEGATIHSVEELRAGLAQLINHVTNRIPYVGTPPAYDIDGVEKFYKQIENAIRFCIHKSNLDIEQFNKQNPDRRNYGEEQTRQLKNLLEDRNRIALDLAIAGKHCAARYMGDSMALYFYFLRNEKIEGGNLGGKLIEILANKRLEIAQREAIARLGNDTHAFTKYMQVMGSLVALPGTSNIIEFLTASHSFDLGKLIPSFFQSYTVRDVIEEIQKQYKGSESFRTLVMEWIVSHMKDWKQNEYEKGIDNKIVRIEEVCKSTEICENVLVKGFISKYTTAKKIGKEQSVDDYVSRLCVTNRELGQSLSVDALGPELFKEFEGFLRGASLREDFNKSLDSRFSLVNKRDAVKRLVPALSIETAERIVNGAIVGSDSIRQAICDALTRERSVEFLGEVLQGKDELPPEVMEWLLVHHRILLPQKAYLPGEPLRRWSDNLSENCMNAIASIVNERGSAWLEEIKLDPRKFLSEPENKIERYQIGNAVDLQARAMALVFNRAFERNPEEVIKITERIEGKRFYPLWKSVCCIHLPKKVGGAVQHLVTSYALSLFAAYRAYQFGRYFSLDLAPRVLLCRVIPFVTTNTPPQLALVTGFVLQKFNWVAAHRLQVLGQVLLGGFVLRRLPSIPYLTPLANALTFSNLCNVLMSGRKWNFFTIVEQLFSVTLSVASLVKNTGSIIGRIAIKGEAHRYSVCKEKAYRLWQETNRPAKI